MELSSYLHKKKTIIDKYLEENLPLENQSPSIIHKSIRYSVLNGGKRIRPILTLMTAELLGENYTLVLPAAAGIELIHTFSLIHDDLPSMDNDDYRRGKLSNHKVFGEAIAILTGDALLVMGLEFICKNAEIKGIKNDSIIMVLNYLLKMLGTKKMLGGQVEDISWNDKEETDNHIENTYLKKTSALICASLKTGALLSNATKKQIDALEVYGKKLGLAFQITDDLLDLKEDKESNNKPTYPEIYGLEKAKKMIFLYSNQAKESISIFGEKAQLFYDLADFIVNRKK